MKVGRGLQPVFIEFIGRNLVFTGMGRTTGVLLYYFCMHAIVQLHYAPPGAMVATHITGIHG